MADIKITLTSQRKLLAIESDNFRITLNGKTNAEYAAAFKVFGVVLQFENEVEDAKAPQPEQGDYSHVQGQQEHSEVMRAIGH